MAKCSARSNVYEEDDCREMKDTPSMSIEIFQRQSHSMIYLQRGDGTEEEGVLRWAPAKVRDGYTLNDVSRALDRKSVWRRDPRRYFSHSCVSWLAMIISCCVKV